MSVIVSHPTGNANVRAVLRGLDSADILSEFWTTLALPFGVIEATRLAEALSRRLAQRSFREVPWSKTKIRPFRETVRLAARAGGLGALTRHETGWASVDGVYRGLDLAVARRMHTTAGSSRAIYAYEDGALESFRAAHQTGRLAIYDLPIAHWRTLRNLLEEEAERLPEWACTMEGLCDSAEKHARKDEEIALADHIIVASSFTRKSLTEVANGKPVHVTPYGCPLPAITAPAVRHPGAPLELLYAGHLAQRKGIADLIAALGLLQIDWRLTLAGPRPATAPRTLDRFLDDPRVTWLGVVPHATLMERMARAHALVFPSIVEGFGMVITEALAAGLPVITTPNTAGPDILEDDVDGLIVPIRAPATLADRITRLADDEIRRQEMAQAAKAKATDMSWMRYESQISELVTGWLKVS